MICLSKADEDVFRRTTWNQAPSPLANAHTTCQDMNGISNLRELVDADQDGGAGGGGGGLLDAAGSGGGAGGGGGSGNDDESDSLSLPVLETELRSDARNSSRKMGLGGEGQPHLSPSPLTASKCGLAGSCWSWFTWLSSVVMASLLLNNLPYLLSRSPAAIDVSGLFHDNVYQTDGLNINDTTTTAIPDTSFSAASPVLARRDVPACGSGSSSKGEYNTPLHAGAVIIVWFVSTLACVFPILAKRLPGLRIPTRFFFAVRHFGTGVLIATAFVHLLPTAFISLGDPCLGSFWTDEYAAMPGAIALAAIFFVAIIEMVFHPSRHLPTEPSTPENGSELGVRAVLPATTALRRTRSESTALPLRGMAPLHGSTANIGYGLTHMQAPEGDGVAPVGASEAEAQAANKPGFYQNSINDSAASLADAMAIHKQKKERLQCILLEIGILFHSVFIGMALSVSVGSDFVVLLIAIVFHQTFEGLALGSRIATVTWAKKTKQPWLMAMAYGCTTPIGQAIGLATSSLYRPDSEVGLLLVGIMNAISAGLLTYASLVELLSEDFLSDESWRILRGKRRVIACFLVFFGAFFMSLVGAWA